MEFHNREKELKRLMKIAKFEPHTIYFIFGPINSGKTALI
ncbi:MAG: ATP-binding protein, partial [Thermoprotei archaeon]